MLPCSGLGGAFDRGGASTQCSVNADRYRGYSGIRFIDRARSR
jgi:hypothetical protein